MNELKTGVFFGDHNQCLQFPGFVLTDTDYTHEKVDWHYHENAYFTYLIQGQLLEANKKETYHLESGSLLFHNWQDAHYNLKPPVYTRGFHVELSEEWFKKFDLPIFDFEGSMQLKHPLIKASMNRIFLASKIPDQHTGLTIEMQILQILEKIRQKTTTDPQKNQPTWVHRLQEMIHDLTDFPVTLTDLASQLDIHPVHLSRQFPRYFDLTLGTYLRQQKVNRAALMIATSDQKLTEISYECGFYDQSHFITNFKKVYHMTPQQFRKRVLAC